MKGLSLCEFVAKNHMREESCVGIGAITHASGLLASYARMTRELRWCEGRQGGVRRGIVENRGFSVCLG